MSQKGISPFTGEPVEIASPVETAGYGRRYNHPGYGTIALYERLLMSFHGDDLSRNEMGVSPADVERAWALLRSLFWRLRRTSQVAFIQVLLAQDYAGWQEAALANPEKWRDSVIYTFEGLVEESQRLTFQRKQTETLINLVDIWMKDGKLPDMDWKSGYSEGHQKRIRFRDSDTPIPGYVFGATRRECPLLLQALYDDGYIGTPVGKDSYDWVVTAKAFRFHDDLRVGADKPSSGGFFVRPYDRKLNVFYEPLIQAIRDTLEVEIPAVWERPHNDRIDERILRLIRDAEVVVVDVSTNNFNVGIELGYALALGKQIVLVREKKRRVRGKDDPNRLPFDISTMNCYFYVRSKPEDLQEVLIARVREALRMARLQRPRLLL